VNWHARYLQQAAWTAQLRRYLYQKAGLTQESRILEPGCGTGAVLADCPAKTPYGLDWDRSSLQIARQTVSRAALTTGNAVHLPFPVGYFDACITHYFLLWIDAVAVLAECLRVTRPGGVIMALAEPDYGARIDYPAELEEIGRMQAESLRQQGADVRMGRKLAGLFSSAGLINITTGILGSEWSQTPDQASQILEWDVIEADVTGRIDPARLENLKQIDAEAWLRGERVLSVPTFYAIGWKPA